MSNIGTALRKLLPVLLATAMMAACGSSEEMMQGDKPDALPSVAPATGGAAGSSSAPGTGGTAGTAGTAGSAGAGGSGPDGGAMVSSDAGRSDGGLGAGGAVGKDGGLGSDAMGSGGSAGGPGGSLGGSGGAGGGTGAGGAAGSPGAGTCVPTAYGKIGGTIGTNPVPGPAVPNESLFSTLDPPCAQNVTTVVKASQPSTVVVVDVYNMAKKVNAGRAYVVFRGLAWPYDGKFYTSSDPYNGDVIGAIFFYQNRAWVAGGHSAYCPVSGGPYCFALRLVRFVGQKESQEAGLYDVNIGMHQGLVSEAPGSADLWSASANQAALKETAPGSYTMLKAVPEAF